MLGASARGSSGIAVHAAGELCLAVHSETQKCRGGRDSQTWVSAFDFSFLQKFEINTKILKTKVVARVKIYNFGFRCFPICGSV